MTASLAPHTATGPDTQAFTGSDSQVAIGPSAVHAVLRLHARASYREVGGEVFVVTEDRGFHRLAAPTAVDLFRRLVRAPCSVEDLTVLLNERYAVALTTAQHDVATFVATLLERHIAEWTPTGSP